MKLFHLQLFKDFVMTKTYNFIIIIIMTIIILEQCSVHKKQTQNIIFRLYLFFGNIWFNTQTQQDIVILSIFFSCRIKSTFL